MKKLIVVLVLVLFGSGTSVATDVDRVLTDRSPNLMLEYFQRMAATKAAKIEAPSSLDDWQERRVELRHRLWDSLGCFPLESRSPLNPTVTGRIDHGDHVVEKIVYQSMPGLYVTALMYVPKEIKEPTAAVLCVNGHWPKAKTDEEIQRRCMGLARMGVIAFCQDVIGTGERSGPQGIPHRGYHGNYRGGATRVTDRTLMGFVIYECIRALDYLHTRPEVDPKRIICTGASGGGMQSMMFAALDDRLAGSVPVCYVGSYPAHMGATACVCEIPTNILRYSDQWEILGLHAPRPLLCINASRDVPVFLPKHMLATLDKTRRHIYSLYGAEDKATSAVIDSGHAYNRAMRELLYNFVAKNLLDEKNPSITEPKDFPVEPAAKLACGWPAGSETLRTMTYHRAGEMVSAIARPENVEEWQKQKQNMLATLQDKILGAFPDRSKVKRKMLREFDWKGNRVQHWVLETEPGLPVPAAFCLPGGAEPSEKLPAVLIVDESGKKAAFERGLAEELLDAGKAVLLIDFRGAGETAATVPAYSGAHDFNLSNYSHFCGRPMTGMRIYDTLASLDFLVQQKQVDAKRISCLGRGHGALVGLLAAALDDRISVVAAEEMPATWVFEEEFLDIGLSYMIPRILTVGDLPHLVACAAPRRVLLLNPVDGRRRPMDIDTAREINRFPRHVYKLFGDGAGLNISRKSDKAAVKELTEWLK